MLLRYNDRVHAGADDCISEEAWVGFMLASDAALLARSALH